MITELTITPEYGDSLTLSVPGPSGGYLVKEIEGLDPVPVSMVSEVIPGVSGEVYQASRREKRNIVLKIKLDLNYASESISSRRLRLYSTFQSGQNLTMGFETSEYGEVTIRGYVEDFVAPELTDTPVATISLVCFDPDFIGSEHIIEGEFDTPWFPLTYEGTAPSGMIINVDTPQQSMTGMNIIFRRPNTGLILGRLETEINFGVNAYSWVINTYPLQKEIRRTTDLSVLRYFNFDSLVWPMLWPGENEYHFMPAEGGGANWSYNIVWSDRYGGI